MKATTPGKTLPLHPKAGSEAAPSGARVLAVHVYLVKTHGADAHVSYFLFDLGFPFSPHILEPSSICLHFLPSDFNGEIAKSLLL